MTAVKWDHGKPVLTVGQLSNHSINLNINILDDTFYKQKDVNLKALGLNQSGSNQLQKPYIIIFG